MVRLRSYIMGIVAAFGGLTGCTPGKHPFRMVQFCLKGSNEIPAFTDFMRNIAIEHQMLFYDRSSDTHQELRALAADNGNVPFNARTVNIGAQHGDDYSFGAGNLGMPTDQIVIGFNGNDMNAARTFADSTVAKLSSRWTIKEVAAGQGAFPLADCE